MLDISTPQFYEINEGMVDCLLSDADCIMSSYVYLSHFSDKLVSITS